MSRVPQPDTFSYSGKLLREPTFADYSDDVSDADLEALKALVKDEVEDEEYELVAGPAW